MPSNERQIASTLDRIKTILGDGFLAPNPKGLDMLRDAVPHLPQDLIDLYAIAGGTLDSDLHDIRLMTPDEIVESIDIFRQNASQPYPFNSFSVFGDGTNGVIFAADNTGNHLGMHLAPPYAGRCFMFDHEDEMFVPRFWSLASLLDSLAKMLNSAPDPFDIYTFVTQVADYPARDPSLRSEEDRELSKKLLAEFKSDPGKHAATALGAVYLSHPDDMAELTEFLDSDDDRVRSEICRLIGLRRYLPAIGHMVRAALERCDNNTIIFAIAALRDWPHADAQAALRSMKDKVAPGFAIYFPKEPS
jgi:hypothetical protein